MLNPMITFKLRILMMDLKRPRLMRKRSRSFLRRRMMTRRKTRPTRPTRMTTEEVTEAADTVGDMVKREGDIGSTEESTTTEEEIITAITEVITDTMDTTATTEATESSLFFYLFSLRSICGTTKLILKLLRNCDPKMIY
jgi:hypothetical protein